MSQPFNFLYPFLGPQPSVLLRFQRNKKCTLTTPCILMCGAETVARAPFIGTTLRGRIPTGEALLGRLQNSRVAFIACDNPVELFQLVRLADGNAQLLDLKGSRVADHVALGLRLGMIAGEAKV